nr:beta-ketoacyl reductase [Okeania sp. SIO2G5]
MSQQTWDRFQTVMDAKIQGSWNLHQLTKSVPLDHFVLFSSAASLIGSAGQSNYAAANAFLDAIAHLRYQSGLPALTINWGAWAGTGLASESTVSEQLTRKGIEWITPDIGLDILDHLMTTAMPQPTAMPQLGVLPGQRWITPEMDFFADLQPSASLSQSNRSSMPTQTSEDIQQDNSQGIMAELLHIAEAIDSTQPSPSQTVRTAQAEHLLNHLRQEVATVLGIQPTVLTDPQAGFTDLGIDSLTAVELRNRLQTSLEQPLRATLIYDYPTLMTLTHYLLERLLPLPQNTREKSVPHGEKEALFADPSDQVLGTGDSLDGLSESELEALLLEELDKLEP